MSPAPSFGDKERGSSMSFVLIQTPSSQSTSSASRPSTSLSASRPARAAAVVFSRKARRTCAPESMDWTMTSRPNDSNHAPQPTESRHDFRRGHSSRSNATSFSARSTSSKRRPSKLRRRTHTSSPSSRASARNAGTSSRRVQASSRNSPSGASSVAPVPSVTRRSATFARRYLSGETTTEDSARGGSVERRKWIKRSHSAGRDDKRNGSKLFKATACCVGDADLFGLLKASEALLEHPHGCPRDSPLSRLPSQSLASARTCRSRRSMASSPYEPSKETSLGRSSKSS